MTIASLEALAQDARPKSEADFASDRQINAENAFFDAFHDAMGETPEFDDWCLKATTDEMIDEALRLARERLASVPSSVQ